LLHERHRVSLTDHGARRTSGYIFRKPTPRPPIPHRRAGFSSEDLTPLQRNVLFLSKLLHWALNVGVGARVIHAVCDIAAAQEVSVSALNAPPSR
jgi:hypothetical protein